MISSSAWPSWLPFWYSWLLAPSLGCRRHSSPSAWTGSWRGGGGRCGRRTSYPSPRLHHHLLQHLLAGAAYGLVETIHPQCHHKPTAQPRIYNDKPFVSAQLVYIHRRRKRTNIYYTNLESWTNPKKFLGSVDMGAWVGFKRFLHP